jgi:L-2,4-diaminobutyrate transaminase
MLESFEGHPIVGEVRGVGMLAAIEFMADGRGRERFEAQHGVGKRIAAACLEEGLIARAMPHGDILGFAPPLVTTEAEVDEIVARTARAIDRVTDELVREGLLTLRAA